MKIFRFTCGADEKIGVFADEKQAYERRAEVDPTFHFLPVVIEEFVVPGYVITITPAEADEFDAMDRDQLKEYLDANEIEYKSNWGDKRLREAARAWVQEQTKEEQLS